MEVITDLFDEQPPVARKWLCFLLRICTRLWPPYNSAGISLYATPCGRLQRLVLSRKERKTKNPSQGAKTDKQPKWHSFRKKGENAESKKHKTHMQWVDLSSVVCCAWIWNITQQ